MLKLSPKKLFLVDGLGALLSALALIELKNGLKVL